MPESESQPAEVMVEKVVRKRAESCRAGTELEIDLGLNVSCLIPDERNFLRTGQCYIFQPSRSSVTAMRVNSCQPSHPIAICVHGTNKS